MKLGKDKKSKAEKTITDHLVEFGLSKEDAENLTDRLGQYKELAGDDISNPQGNGNSEGFKEREARDINIEGQARMDMARFLLEINPADSIEKKVVMSEIPAPSLMHLVMSKTMDDLCSKRNGDKKVTPIEVFLSNYTTFMRGLNRKSRKEGLQVFEVDADKSKEQDGLFPPSLKG